MTYEDRKLEIMEDSDEVEIPSEDGTRWMLRKDPRFRKGADEVWEEMPGVVGLLVSTHGRIQTKLNGNWRQPFRPKTNKQGYRRFNYKAPGMEKSKMFGVHACVVTTFLGPPPTRGHTADHVDVENQEGRGNNCIWNLRWASKSEQKENQRKPEEAKQEHALALAKLLEEETTTGWSMRALATLPRSWS